MQALKEKLTVQTSWWLQECDNDTWWLIIRTSSNTILDHPLSLDLQIMNVPVEPAESEDIPVGLLCLLVGFCGIASGVMQSNLF